MPESTHYWKDPEKHRAKSLAYYYAHHEEKKRQFREYAANHKSDRQEYNKKYREENREKLRTKDKENYRKNREKRLEQSRLWQERNPGHRRKRTLANYGITPEQFQKMFDDQKGLCAICPSPLTNPCIDHDHACCPQAKACCGKCVRGLLCSTCNSGLGQFKDAVPLLKKAISYLEGSNFSRADETIRTTGTIRTAS